MVVAQHPTSEARGDGLDPFPSWPTPIGRVLSGQVYSVGRAGQPVPVEWGATSTPTLLRSSSSIELDVIDIGT